MTIEATITCVPAGWRYTLILISHAKRTLTYKNCPADVRAKTLEHFENWSLEGEWLSPEMIAIIDPMPDAGEEIIDEAIKLGWPKAFDVFAKLDVFDTFIAINPSIQQALNWRHDRSRRGIR